MSRLACLFAGLLMVSSLSGCCLFGHGGGYAPMGGGGYYGGGNGGACGCGSAAAGGYPSAMYAPGIQQTAFVQPQAAGYPVVAAAPPQDVLGTY
ncbi:MAG: hypothetical protein H7Z17_18420 [Fuerstia sp.]|nr:hypothetical protein [Fuerstiella sp.]